MFFADPITGDGMPDKTLCFTFDDGPGPLTLPIAEYLSAEGISATFFVVGKYAIHHPEILQAVQALGHTVANHTFEHPDMPWYWSVNGDVNDQVLRTAAVIKKYTNGSVYFRSPYGKWSAEVADTLNTHMMVNLQHIGPIHWDIGGVDCYYWQTGRTVEAAMENYLQSIREKGKGIVVFHDEIADMDVVKPKNKTLELLQQLVPELKRAGYYFTALENVPAIKAKGIPQQFYLKTSGGKYIGADNTIEKTLQLNSVKGPSCLFTASILENGKITLITAAGLHFTLSDIENEALTTAPFTNRHLQTFDFIPVTGNQFMLRVCSGRFITVCNKTNRLFSGAQYMRTAAIFTFAPVDLPQPKITFKIKLLLIKRGFAFIKSKVLSR